MKNTISAEEAAYLSFLDIFYYRIERWIPLFKKRIIFLESGPRNLETQLELMKYHFYLGGLDLELAHILGVNSEYKNMEIEKDFLFNIRQASRIAKNILKRKGLTDRQRAQAYFYLGATKGSLGIAEFRTGNILSALIKGFQADNHLEKALILEPRGEEAHLGLGIYRYGNSRLGGLGNLLLQAGRDRRQEGLSHIELAIRADGISAPLAIKTLAWFYIAVRINPGNAELPKDNPLSPLFARNRVHQLLGMMEHRYFINPPVKSFIGNKEFTMIKAIQSVLDSDYSQARDQFEKVLKINEFLRKTKGYKINSRQDISIRVAIEFCDVMLMNPPASSRGNPTPGFCLKIKQKVVFLNNGGRVFEYDVKKLQDEINAIFFQRLMELSQSHCTHRDVN